jgi:hypothetical protein
MSHNKNLRIKTFLSTALILFLGIFIFSCSNQDVKGINKKALERDSLYQLKNQKDYKKLERDSINAIRRDSLYALLLSNLPFENVNFTDVVFDFFGNNAEPYRVSELLKYAKLRGVESNYQIKNNGEFYSVLNIQKGTIKSLYTKDECEQWISNSVWKNQLEANSARVLLNKGKYSINNIDFDFIKNRLKDEGVLLTDDDY